MFVVSEKLEIEWNKVALEEVIGDIRVLNDAFEVAQNIVLLLSLHAIQYFFEF